MSIQDLPYDVLYEQFQSMDYEDIQNFCKTNRNIRTLCTKDPNFQALIERKLLELQPFIIITRTPESTYSRIDFAGNVYVFMYNAGFRFVYSFPIFLNRLTMKNLIESNFNQKGRYRRDIGRLNTIVTSQENIVRLETDDRTIGFDLPMDVLKIIFKECILMYDDERFGHVRIYEFGDIRYDPGPYTYEAGNLLELG
jgi:hypothetical protein